MLTFCGFNDIIVEDSEVKFILNLYFTKDIVLMNPIDMYYTLYFNLQDVKEYSNKKGWYLYNYNQMKDTKKDLNDEIKKGFAEIMFHPKKIAELIEKDSVDNYINSFD
jgi:hypothetical protein